MAGRTGTTMSPEELNHRIEEVEAALARVSKSIHQLEEESQQAKADISDSFDKHLTELHNHHIQLLRQVDVLYRERRNSLQKQLAQCSRLLGTLTTTQQYAAHLYKNCNQIQIQGIAGVKSFGAAGHLRLSLDDEPLTSAITGFGKVDMDGFLVFPNEESYSQCMPSRVEEYQDDDTIVLNKPLNSESGTIEIRFPQLPKDYSYWLARKSLDIAPPKQSTPMAYRKAADDSRPCDVQTWLAHIQQETAAEPIEADFPSCSSTASESIEVVSAMDCMEKTLSMTSTCCQQPILNVEIENLADTFGPCVVDKQKWLSPRTKPHSEIPVAMACKANETCSSFEDCLCETSCYEVALKKREEKEKQTFQAKWLRNLNVKDTTDNKFQMPQQHGLENASYWLRPKHSNQDSVPVIQDIFPALDETAWLRKTATCIPAAKKVDVLPPPAAVEQHEWLRPAAATNPKDEANQQLKENTYADWLLKRAAAAAADRSWLREQQTTGPLLRAIKELKEMKIHERFPEEEAWSKWLLRRF